MAALGRSPKSSLRKSIRDINRSRGHGNHNLWLVYSPKIDRDLVFPSDRQFIHWLYFLEFNLEVSRFDCAPGVIPSHDGIEPRGTELDAIVWYRNSPDEWHEVKAGESIDPAHQSQFSAQRNAAEKSNAIYRIFNDKDLAPVASIAIRWLELIAYAAAIRDEPHTHHHNSVAFYMQNQKHGSFQDLYEALPNIDPEVLIGVIVRMAAKGFVAIDIHQKPFGDATRWCYGE
jgi:hypothetical protein